jgi:uncharacterized membrane protein YbhN (UPF0104 family)
MRPSPRRLARVAGLAISGTGLWFAFRGLDWTSAAATIRQLRVGPLLLVAVPLVVGTMARALRWHVLLRRSGSTLGASVEALLVGTFFTGVLPFRAGEAARVAYFAQRTGAPLASAAAALLLERALDVSTLGIAALAVLPPRARLPALALPPWAFAGFGAAVAVALAAAAWALRRRSVSADAGGGGRFLARIREQALASLSFLSSGRDAALVVLLSLATWPLTALPGILVFRSAGVPVAFEEGLVILIVVTLAIALPSTPGFVGTFHAGFVLGAQVVGLRRDVSAPVALVTHLLFQVPFIIGGAAVLAAGGAQRLRTAVRPESVRPEGRDDD